MDKERYEVDEQTGEILDNHVVMTSEDIVDRLNYLKEQLKKANINNYLNDYYFVEKENQQLKQKVNNWKQRFEASEKRYQTLQEHFIKVSNLKNDKIEKLKQSQNQKAIEVLEDIRKTIRYAKEICGGKATDLDIVSANAYNRCLDDMQKIIDNQIKSLKGE